MKILYFVIISISLFYVVDGSRYVQSQIKEFGGPAGQGKKFGAPYKFFSMLSP
jgi:hypothetical protein